MQRSFILNTQAARERAVQLKLSPIVSEIEGRDILLVDDSIVRGTTSKNIVRMLRKYGAKKRFIWHYLPATCDTLVSMELIFPSSKELSPVAKN